MNNYPINFYDLLTRALGNGDAYRLQGFLDEVFAEKYNALQIDGFAWGEMQLDFTYEQIEKEVGLNVMASYVDLDSPAVPIGTEGVSLYTGRIPRQKAVEYYNEDKSRKMLIAEQRFGASADRVREAALRDLFVTTDKLIGGHTNAITYQRNQMVSNGKLVLTNTNNPRGIQNVTFSAHIPAANIVTKAGTARWWTAVNDGVYSTPGAACDPIADLQAMVRALRQKGISRAHFEVQDAYLDQVLNHPSILNALGYAVSPDTQSASAVAKLLPRDKKIQLLGEIVGAPIRAIDSLVAVEKWDATTKALVRDQFQAFEDNVFVLVPDGNIGTIIPVEPIAMPGATNATFLGGRGLLTVGVDAVAKCQSFNTECTVLAVPNTPRYMLYLHPYGTN